MEGQLVGIPQHPLDDGTTLPAIGFGIDPLRRRAGAAVFAPAADEVASLTTLGRAHRLSADPATYEER